MTGSLWIAHDGYWWSGATRGASCDGFVLGTTKPDATNTGYAPGTTFTQVTSDITYTTDGQVIEDTEFIGGKVYVKASGVTFRNCWFRGQQDSNETTDPFVRCHWDASVNTTFERCTFGSADQVGWPDCGILGHNFTATRCDISRSQDGIRNVNSDTAADCGDITVHGCYIHDLLYVSPYSAQSDNQSHNDVVQLVGGDNIEIKGCTLRAYVDPDLGAASTTGVPLLSDTDSSGLAVTGDHDAWMTAFIVTPNQAMGAATVDQCWLEGGQFTVNIAIKNATYWSASSSITLTDNRFGKDTRIGQNDLNVSNDIQSYVTSTGNTFPDSSSVPMSNGG